MIGAPHVFCIQKDFFDKFNIINTCFYRASPVLYPELKLLAVYMDERILLVEDEPFIAREEVRVLEQHGYQVTAVHSGERAVETVSNDSRFSLILMDISLGTGIDGAETARRILARCPVPVLFLTCHKEAEFVERVKDIPSYGYILKDAGEYVLIESVRSALTLFRSSDGICTRKYRRIVENTNELICEVDEADDIVFVNSQYEKILGYSPDELLGRQVEILVHPDDLPQATERYYAIRAEVSSTLEVVRFRHKDGSYRTFECRGTVYVNNSGKKSTIILSRDITEQEKAEHSLRTSKARFAAFMDHFPGAAFIKDRENRLLFCNRLYAPMLNASPEQLINFDCVEQVPADLQEIYERENREVLTEGKIITTESVFPCDGKNTYWLTYKFPIRIEEETLLGAISIEITAQKEAEHQLQKALDEKQYLMRELSHRVKNNFQMVKSLLHIKERTDGIDLGEVLKQIDTIRIVHEKLHENDGKGPINFDEYCSVLLENIFSTSPIQPVSIEASIPRVQFEARAAMTLGLIINELATNSVKYGFTSDVEARFIIDLRELEDERTYRLTVSNTGNPFPEEIDFENLKSIGLQLIQVMVQQLDGKLEITRRPHPVFSIDFPRQ